MADEETYILTKEDFQEQQEVIKKQILGNTKLEGREKRMALTPSWTESVNPSWLAASGSTGSPNR